MNLSDSGFSRTISEIKQGRFQPYREKREVDARQEIGEKGKSLIVDEIGWENGLVVIKLFDIRWTKICGKQLEMKYLKAYCLPREQIIVTIHSDYPKHLIRIGKELADPHQEKLHLHLSEQTYNQYKNILG